MSNLNSSLELLDLPHELLAESILVHLDVNSLLNLSRASRALFAFSRDPSLWKSQCLERWVSDKLSNFRFSKSWFATYIRILHQDVDTARIQLWHPYLYTRSVYLDNKYLRQHMDLSKMPLPDLPDVLKVSIESAFNLSVSRFRVIYKIHSKPLLIQNAMTNWPCMKWTLDSFKNDYPTTLFRIANDNGTKRTYLRMNLNSYKEYAQTIQDESPMIDYKVPKYFETDYLKVLGKDRPPYRWIIIAGKRSGSTWHIDPNGTSAWNFLIKGRKRWAFYPPNCTPPGITKRPLRYEDRHSESESNEEHPTPIWWFLEVYPTLPVELKPMEVIQMEGETIFVPSGWFHLVLNLEDTIAITQNYINRTNLSNLVLETLRNDKSRKTLLDPFIQLCPELGDFMTSRIDRVNRDQSQDDIIKLEGYSNRIEYMKSFKDVIVWKSRVKIVLKHVATQYAQQDLKMVDNGQIYSQEGVNPIFRTGNYIIKFFCYLFSPNRNFHAEVQSLLRLEKTNITNCEIPKLIGHGNLCNFLPNLPWKWPFVVVSLVDGIGYDEVIHATDLEQTSFEPTRICVDRRDLARWLGHTIASIHSTKRNAAPKHDVEYFQERLKKVVENHSEWAIFPPHLIANLDSYLPGKIDDLFTEECVYLLHGDVNPPNIRGVLSMVDSCHRHNNNLLINTMDAKDSVPCNPINRSVNHDLNSNTSNQLFSEVPAEDKVIDTDVVANLVDPFRRMQWRPSAIIDFADAHVCGGDPHFDISILYAYIFKCRDDLLQIFLMAYNACRVRNGLKLFVFDRHRAMQFMLLYEFRGVVTAVQRHKPRISVTLEDEMYDANHVDSEFKACRTWEEIEQEIFGNNR